MPGARKAATAMSLLLSPLTLKSPVGRRIAAVVLRQILRAAQ